MALYYKGVLNARDIKWNIFDVNTVIKGLTKNLKKSS